MISRIYILQLGWRGDPCSKKEEYPFSTILSFCSAFEAALSSNLQEDQYFERAWVTAPVSPN